MSNMTEWADRPADDDGPFYRDYYYEYMDWNTTADEDEVPPAVDTPGCQLYNFIMYALVGGSVCVFGCVGNVLAFVVFWRDKVKTSTSLLFQVRLIHFSLTCTVHHLRQRGYVFTDVS